MTCIFRVKTIYTITRNTNSTVEDTIFIIDSPLTACNKYHTISRDAREPHKKTTLFILYSQFWRRSDRDVIVLK